MTDADPDRTAPRADASGPDGGVTVGVVGLGGLGRKHSRLVRDGEATLVGGVDVSEAARREFTAEFDVPCFETFEELHATGVDAVVITTPNRFHEEYAVAALDAGVHVLCEKPLADSVAGAERIVAAARRSEAVCTVGFNNRFNPPVQTVLDAREDGSLGEIAHVEAKWLRRCGVPGTGTWFTQRRLAGGGALIDLGVHVIDLALHLLGDATVVEVSGVTRARFDCSGEVETGPPGRELPEPDVEDAATAFLRCEDGRTISVDVAWATHRGESDEFVVTGSDGGARFTLHDPDVTFYDLDADESSTTVLTDGSGGYVDEHRQFFDAVRSGGGPGLDTLEQACTVQRIIEAIYRSDAEGRAVRLDTDGRCSPVTTEPSTSTEAGD